MNSVLATALIIAALIGALWSLILLFLSRPAGKKILLGALGLIEIGLLVQAVLGFIALAGHHRPIENLTFICYLVGSLLILPAAAWWSLTDRTRWSVGVLLIGCLVIPVMIVRMNQVWAGTSV